MNKCNNKNLSSSTPDKLPVIPTMDVVVFPRMVVPLLVLDEHIIAGIHKTLEESKLVLLLASNNQNLDEHSAVSTDDLYKTGTVANIMRIIKIPDGGVKILVQGLCRAQAEELSTVNGVLYSSINFLESEEDNQELLQKKINQLKQVSQKMAESGQTFNPDFHILLNKMNDPEKIIDFVFSHINVNVEESQALLELENDCLLIDELTKHLGKEMEVAEAQEKIKSFTRDSMNRSHKEIYLREQLRAIKKELGEDDDQDIDSMREDLASLPVNDEVRTEINRQINRLEKTAPDSMEASVIRTYLEWIIALPWGKETKDNLDIEHAKQILEEDHYGLKEIKERILDFISIRHLKQDGHTPILCFVGPPGVGKTSLGKSIARALGRNHFRISLGGVKDEAEIRGHRRTYVGAMPGRFIQGIRKAGTLNPIIIIDELDKIGNDFRGDPSAAMLEILDPQQNSTFYDNYLGVPFDLSKTIFIATANSLDTISEPLRDRMEIIELSGYTMEEKVQIAKRYLIDKSAKDAGLENHTFIIKDDLVQDIIHSYCRESGVRELDRVLRKLGSKAARCIVEEKKEIEFTCNNIEDFLGPRRFIDEEDTPISQVGISNGLAWTAYGGELLRIEAVIMPGKGRLLLTGQLGDVMKESAQAAMSYARSHSESFGIDNKMFTDHDLHIHVPAGGVPKDGPSAGITMLSSILSTLTQRPINAQYAMTGELNLRGNVMPVGGIKEKILAAKQNKVLHIILPIKNKKDIIGMEADALNGIEVIWVEHADEVINRVLMPRGK